VKHRLVLMGAGGFAKEVLWTCSQIPADQRAWEDICLIDDDLDASRARLNSCGVQLDVISTIYDFFPGANDQLVCTVGDPRIKLDICNRMLERGGRFANVIHPTVTIGPRSTLGQGVIMEMLSGLSVDVTVGNFVTINAHTGCGHDAVVEDGCTISAFCDVTGHAHLERGVFLGSHATIMPGVRVGEYSVVGAGSVAIRNVKAGQTVIGVPAKVLM